MLSLSSLSSFLFIEKFTSRSTTSVILWKEQVIQLIYGLSIGWILVMFKKLESALTSLKLHIEGKVKCLNRLTIFLATNYIATFIIQKTSNLTQIYNLLLSFSSVRLLCHCILPGRCKWHRYSAPDRFAPPVGRFQVVGPKQRGVVQTGGGQRLPEDPEPVTPAWCHSDGS